MIHVNIGVDRVPNPDKPGWFKYDPEGYHKLLEQQRAKRLDLMIEIMKSRGLEYDIVPIFA